MLIGYFDFTGHLQLLMRSSGLQLNVRDVRLQSCFEAPFVSFFYFIQTCSSRFSVQPVKTCRHSALLTVPRGRFDTPPGK